MTFSVFILYDLDGTLVDSRADLALAVNLARRDFGLAPLPEAAVAACVGEGVQVLVARAIPECAGRLDEAVAAMRRHYAAHLLDHTVPYPGVREALAAAGAAGFGQAVVTNKPRPATEAILRGLGLEAHFAAIVGGGDAAVLKPDPAPLRLALERAGWRGADADVWMVGDHYTDLAAARAAGFRRCFCRYGIGETRGEAWDLAVDDLRELIAALSAPPAARRGLSAS